MTSAMMTERIQPVRLAILHTWQWSKIALYSRSLRVKRRLCVRLSRAEGWGLTFFFAMEGLQGREWAGRLPLDQGMMTSRD